MANPIRAIKNLIRFARVTAAGGDDKDFPVQQVEYLGKTGDTAMWFPYGVSANIPPDFLALILSTGANPEARIAFPASPKERLVSPLPSPLASGELLVFNPLTQAFVHFRSDGSIEVKTPTDLDMTVAGNVNLIVDGNVVADIEGDLIANAAGDADIDIGGAAAIDVVGNTAITTPTLNITAAVNIVGDVDIEGDFTQEGDALLGDGGLVNLAGTGGKPVGRVLDSADDPGFGDPDNRINTGSDKVRAIGSPVRT